MMAGLLALLLAASPAIAGGVSEKDCEVGCSAGDAPKHASVPTFEELAILVDEVAAQPLGTPSLELETLLFHAAETRHLLEQQGPGALNAEQEAFLRGELARTHARFEMRVIDETGRERARLEPTPVPMGIKQHVEFAFTGDLGHLEAAGTIRRVGLYHLWSRW